MSNFKIRTFLVFIDPMAGQRGSRKVWGWAEVGGALYNFWGRLPDGGKTQKHLTFKYDRGTWNSTSLVKLTLSKIKKGYRVVDCRTLDDQYPEIESVYPNFVDSFQNQLMLARLSDNIKNTGRFLAGSHD